MTRRNLVLVLGRWCFVTMLASFATCTTALSFSSSSTATTTSLSSPQQSTKPHAIVVGGGPIGLATALMLSHHHSYDVTVYEATPYEEYCQFDASKAFLYLVSSRGQDLTNQFPELQRKLVERGVPSSTPFILVPSTKDKPVPGPGQSFLAKNADFGEKDESDGKDDETNESKEILGYWIPRHEMNEILCDTISELKQRTKNDFSVGNITIHFGVSCHDLKVSEDQASISVITKDTKGQQSTQSAKLVVAGDGNNSKVRQILSQQDPHTSTFPTLDPSFRPKKFQVRQWTSPATHLRLKALQLPPNTPIPQQDAPTHHAIAQHSYSYQGTQTGPRSFFKLGCLPMKNPNVIRPANVCTRPDHDIWQTTNGEEVRQMMQKNFPRMEFQPEAEGGIISDAEWDRFAKAKGISFPYCQYCPKLVVSSSSSEKQSDCGIVLLGDAAHSFPPDTGQGINAGLSDVVYLDKVLTNGKGKQTLSESLKSYEKVRAPETRALIRLARFGFPYQYGQAHYIDRFRKMLCLGNLALRLLLNKITFGLTAKPAIMMAMDKGVTYRQAMRRADTMTAIFTSLIIGFLAKKVLPLFL